MKKIWFQILFLLVLTGIVILPVTGLSYTDTGTNKNSAQNAGVIYNDSLARSVQNPTTQCALYGKTVSGGWDHITQLIVFRQTPGTDYVWTYNANYATQSPYTIPMYAGYNFTEAVVCGGVPWYSDWWSVVNTVTPANRTPSGPFWIEYHNLVDQSLIHPSNMGVFHNNSWFNITSSSSGVFYFDFGANGENYTAGDPITICGSATGFYSNCYSAWVPLPNTTLIAYSVPINQTIFPNTTPGVNVTVAPFNTFVVPTIVIINRSAYRDSINSTIIGNISQGLLNQVDEMFNSVNTSAMGVVNFGLTPITMITSYWIVGMNYFTVTFTSLIGYTAFPLQVTAMVVNIMPWQIQAIITLGLTFDLIFIILFGG